MKIAAAGLYVTLLLFLLTGCGGETKSTPVAQSTTAVEPAAAAKTETPPADTPKDEVAAAKSREELTSDVKTPATPAAAESKDESAKPEVTPAATTPAEKPAAPNPSAATVAAVAVTTPATWAEAAKVIDLRTFPLSPHGEHESDRALGSVNYVAKGTPRENFRFFQEQFKKLGWTELSETYLSDESCNGVFTNRNFLVSLSTFLQDKPNETSVMLISHGNVDSRSLPTPPDVTTLYASATNAMYVTELKVPQAAEAVRKLLLADAWEPYGTAGDSADFRRNAVLVTATVSEAPAQDNKTVISYSTQLLSHDFPLVPEAFEVQYSDSPAQLSFDVKKPYEEIVTYYRNALAKQRWKSTTDNTVKIDWKDFLIFRNPQKELMELQLTTVEGVSRGMLRFQTAEEVAAEEKAFQEAKARKMAESKKPVPKVEIRLPEGADELESTASSVEFKIPLGKAEASTRALVKNLEAAGWKSSEGTRFEPMFGIVLLSRNEESLTINYVETGVLPPEIRITSSGVELVVGGQGK